MSTITTCIICGAFEEFAVYPSWHPQRGELYTSREKPCRCPAIEPVQSLDSEYDRKREERECEVCRKPCRARYCLSCSNEIQAERARVSWPTRESSPAPLPKCACGAQLHHPLALRCKPCKRERDRWKSYERTQKPKAA